MAYNYEFGRTVRAVYRALFFCSWLNYLNCLPRLVQMAKSFVV